MIISFSGIDSAGKSTQIRLLEHYLNNKGIKYIKKWGKIRGTPGIILLKSLVRKDKHMTHNNQKEYRNAVYSSRLKQHVLFYLSIIDFIFYFGFYYRLINLFYRFVICDRYLWDSYIEAKTEFTLIDIDRSLLWKLAKIIVPKPRHSFILTIPPEVSKQRDICKKDPTIDGIEMKILKIRLYNNLINQNRWNHVLDGMLSIEEIHARIKEILKIDNQGND